MMMNWADDLMKEFPEISVAKKRLEYWQERYNELEKENERLKHENEELTRESARMKKQINEQLQTAGFVEAEGVLWKKKANGQYERNPYCPVCKLVMSPSPPMLPVFISCIKCSFTAPFKPDYLQEIISELPK